MWRHPALASADRAWILDLLFTGRPVDDWFYPAVLGVVDRELPGPRGLAARQSAEAGA